MTARSPHRIGGSGAGTSPSRRSTAAVAAVVVALALALVLGSAGPAGAQAVAPDEMTIVSVDTSGQPTVTATVAIPTELADAPPSDLQIVVTENGQERPSTPTRLPGDELEVVLLVDTSGSMAGEPIIAAKAAARAFIAQIPPGTTVAVVGFGNTARVVTGLTDDGARLDAAIEELQAAGDTALYDGVGAALDQLPPAPHTRRQIVLLSDGGDTRSQANLEATAARIRENGARLDVAELQTAESNHGALQALADAGRGSVASATDPAGLTAIFDALARGLAHQYQVSFVTTGRGSTTLTVRVFANGRAEASASTTVDLAGAGATDAPSSTPPTTEAPVESVIVQVGWLASSAALVLGLLCCIAALLLLASLWVFHEPKPRPGRLGPLYMPGGIAAPQAVTSFVQRAAEATDRTLERLGLRDAINVHLEQAGIALKAGEVVLLVAASVVFVGGLLALIFSPLIGLIGAAAIVFAAFSIVNGMARRRRRDFADQLGDNLVMMSGSLRTGYAVLPALDLVSRESPSPSGDEFRRVVTEVRLGRDLNASLEAMADRVGGEDFQWVAQAIEINREVGGDLAEVLDHVASTIRERARLRRQVRTISAEGRLSAVVLIGLPIVLGLLLAFVNPEYMSELTKGTGLWLVATGGVLLVIGGIWVSRIVKVKY